MAEESSTQTHFKISRPPGFSGYNPKRYCCVCGYTTVGQHNDSIKCQKEDCNNECHIKCCDEEEEPFCCSQTESLRQYIGILHTVKYEEQLTTNSTSLLTSTSTEPITCIETANRVIKEQNATLARLTELANSIAAQRDNFVKVLNIIDTFSTTALTLRNITTKDIASSAIPDRIDEDWEHHLTDNSAARIWWNSGSPKTIRIVKTANPTTDLPQAAMPQQGTQPQPSSNQESSSPVHTSPPSQPNTGSTQTPAQTATHTFQPLTVESASPPHSTPMVHSNNSRTDNRPHTIPPSTRESSSSLYTSQPAPSTNTRTDNRPYTIPPSTRESSSPLYTSQPAPSNITRTDNRPPSTREIRSTRHPESRNTQRHNSQPQHRTHQTGRSDPALHQSLTEQHQQWHQQALQDQQKCSTCRRKGHMAQNCPRCTYCSRYGHIEEDCKTKKEQDFRITLLHQAHQQTELLNRLQRFLPAYAGAQRPPHFGSTYNQYEAAPTFQQHHPSPIYPVPQHPVHRLPPYQVAYA